MSAHVRIRNAKDAIADAKSRWMVPRGLTAINCGTHHGKWSMRARLLRKQHREVEKIKRVVDVELGRIAGRIAAAREKMQDIENEQAQGEVAR